MAKLPFGFEKPEDSPGFLLWQTTMVWQRLIKQALEPHAISHASFVILATLLWFEAHDYDTTQILIAQWSKLDKMTVSKSLKILVAEGFVNRIEHKKDTRAKSVSLTKKGFDLIHQLVPIVEQIDVTFFGRVPDQEQKSLITILNQLTMEETC
ncbi:MAG: winged helix-turn-helix transcriptional regulator [Gammaproteobacteria bacterium]|nr:winged helix-turn-helix transcriptional regulator [Gammaproteobacteria bacterium]MBP9729709.1 winged helix-turn-helix transcriptional regulator [Gammaproteobacteria bacterium]